jgi:predicted DNA-binding transcriptional regulator AlpA
MPARSEVTGRRQPIGVDPLALLSKKQLAALLAIDVWTVDRWRKSDPTFPQPIWVTNTTPRWRRADVEAWLSTRKKGGRSPAWDEQSNKPQRSRRATEEARDTN